MSLEYLSNHYIVLVILNLINSSSVLFLLLPENIINIRHALSTCKYRLFYVYACGSVIAKNCRPISAKAIFERCKDRRG